MMFTVRDIGLEAPEEVAVFSKNSLYAMGARVNSHMTLESGTLQRYALSCSVDMPDGEVLLPASLIKGLGVKDGDQIDIRPYCPLESERAISRKIAGHALSDEEIRRIVNEISERRVLAVGLSAFSSALEINGFNLQEMASFVKALVETGNRISFDRVSVFDFHSLGGVPGNKITPIVVSIVASQGLYIPKTSSRAISSACGTADIVETFCNIELSESRLKSITEAVGGAFAWGGSMNLAPADDIMIEVESQLRMNPRSKMIASILSKKICAGATQLLMDIPVGPAAKVRTLEEAHQYARDFMGIGEKIGIHVECAITSADQPIGYAIGPVLEAREMLRVLEGNAHPTSVVEKSCEIAGMILEMAGYSDGATKAREILENGTALSKFREIVKAQGGDPDIRSEDLVPGKYFYDVRSTVTGYVSHIDNSRVVSVAKAAGSPSDKGAGLIFRRKKGSEVTTGDTLFTIYADSEDKLFAARSLAVRCPPVTVEGAVISKMTHGRS